MPLRERDTWVAAGDAVRYRVRLRDVAKQAGVAPSTASAVLNGRAEEARIAPPTQERVRAPAAELG
jgi:LacI family transcriptional regulator